MPSGRASMRFSFDIVCLGSFICSRAMMDFSRSSTRSTMFSPHIVGCADTRKSTGRPFRFSDRRPSWGARVSAMFMPLITFRRTAMPGQ